jgi:hypothetical protein
LARTSITLVSAGPLCGGSEAARGLGLAVRGFASGRELMAFSGFSAEPSPRAATRIPDVIITIPSTK